MQSTMLLFTQSGRCYWLKVYEIPEGSRASKGRAIQNVLSIPDDKIKTYINVKTLKDEEYVNAHSIALVTKRGIIKKTVLAAYSHPRAAGVNAVNLREGDELIEAMLTNGNEQVLIAARDGRCCRFEETDVRPMGRNSTGVRGINIDEDDCVIGAIHYDPASEDAVNQTVLVVSERGFGKRTDFEEYRITRRGGKGVRTINITEKTGKLISIKNVTEANDLMIIEKSGLTIRMAVSDIRVAGRATQGVKLINIKEGDSIAAVSVVDGAEEEASGETENNNTDNNQQI
jgi:DNA gyrase subunit A